MKMEDKYYIDDPESGFYEITKEEHDRYTEFMRSMFEAARPRLYKNPKVKYIIVGTIGNLDNNQDLSKIFYNPMWGKEFKRTEPWPEDKGLHSYFVPSNKTEDNENTGR